MRFLLRCIFCLSMVYGAILRQGGYLPAFTASVAQALPGTAAEAGRKLATGVGAVCDHDPSGCLAAAARLNGLLAPAAEAAPASGRRQERRRGAIVPVSPYMER